MNAPVNTEAARIVGIGTALLGVDSSYRIWMLTRDMKQDRREDPDPPEKAERLESEYFYIEFAAGDLLSSSGPYFTLDDARRAAEQLTYHFRTRKHPTH
jgi:hypothetical protein